MSRHPLRTCVLLALLLGGTLPIGAAGPQRVHEIAVAAPRPPGAPAYSDVCFSSRWKHPSNAEDPHNTFETAKAFSVTRYLWAYTSDAKFIEEAKKTANSFQCALNSMVADHPGGGRQQGRLMDLDGNLVSAPWMRAWKDPAWGCCNSTEWRASYLAAAKAALEAGADLFQMDDPVLNLGAMQWGACFCPYCMAGFRDYLADHSTPEQRASWGIVDLADFDYATDLRAQGAPAGDAFGKWDGGPLKAQFRDFLQASVARFYQDIRGQIDAYAGRHVPFSSNNYAGRWTFPYDHFDFGVAEIPHRDLGPALMYERFKEARDRGKAQVFTLVSEDVALTRRVIATAYATGGHLLVPWDVYLGSTPEGSRRYYGKPEDYADLYRFVRGHADLFDGYEDAAFVLPGRADTRYPERPPVQLDGAGTACAFVRAIPGQPDAPVALHLVDWSDTPEDRTVRIDPTQFGSGGALQVQCLRPGAEPVDLVPMVLDGPFAVEVPPLSPWGILRLDNLE